MAHQGYAIELYFDKPLETQVLKKAINMESRPHITLFSTQFLEPPKLQKLLQTFASNQEPLCISLSSVGSFPKDGDSLFLSPTPSLQLLELQRELCDEIKKLDVEIGVEYCADSWVPHCIVAQDVGKERMAECVSGLCDLKLPVNGFGVEIGLVELKPVREELFAFTLGCAVED